MKKRLSLLRASIPARILGWISVPFFVLGCLFIMDYMNFIHYDDGNGTLYMIRRFISLHPGSFVFEVLVMFVLFAILLGLVRKVWIAGGILGTVSCICAYVNFVKVALNGDPFFPKDILMTGQMDELLSFVHISVPSAFWLGCALVVLLCVVYAVLDTKLALRWYIRIPGALLLCLVVFLLFSSAMQTRKTLDAFGMHFEDTGFQFTNYKAHGFVGAFSLNLLSMRVTPPEDYSRAGVDAFLAPYEESARTNEENFDVITVLSESFFDLRTLPGISFSQNPLTNYDATLAFDRCYSGRMVSTATGGGTVRPEFDLLTGLTTDCLPLGASPYEYVTHPFETYVSRYKAAGYHTVALHPYDKSFYARESAYESLGFDEFYGLDEICQLVDVSYKRGYCTDESVLEAAKIILAESDEPVFLFIITMENHQPYGPIPEEDVIVDVTCDALEPDVLSAVRTYTQGLHDADLFLAGLRNWVDSSPDPAVLLFFGDHLPTLGPNFAAYTQTGYFTTADGLNVQELLDTYSTPFLIYANQAMEIHMFPTRQDNCCSCYHLLNAVAQGTGFGHSRYMNLLLDFYQTTPVYNERVTPYPDEETQFFSGAMNTVTYDRIKGDGYSMD